MLKSLVKALGMALCERKQGVGFLAGLTLSGAACALGMGGINVITGLGEPLKADIELVAVSKAEKGSLTARLASPEVFKSTGVEYPSSVPQLKFKIEMRANGEPYLRVTTVDPVNEPYISMLVELSWPSGKLLREYTFLLDPPGFKPELVREAEVEPVAPSVVSAPAEQKPEAVKSDTVPIRATAPMDEKAFAAGAPAKKAGAGGATSPREISVKRGDTLRKIANQNKPSDVSLERMLVALYRANADAFDGKNMNRLKAGKILRLPDQYELDNLQQKDSVKEIHAQAVDWNAYRQKLAAASVTETGQAPKQEASGKISTTVTDKAPAAKETAKEVVRLSKGEMPSGKVSAGGTGKAAQDKAHQEEEAIAKSKALKESSERIALLEKNAQAMQRLIELKNQSAAKPEAAKQSGKTEEPAPTVTTASAVASASAVSTASAVVSASAVVASSAVKAADAASAVKPAGKPVVKPAVPQPSLTDEILGEPLYMAGGAAVLLALGGLGYAMARRRKGVAVVGSDGAEDTGSSSGRILAPAAPSPETGDFTGVAVAAAPAAANVTQTEEVDPISEADLFLNFGRDAQAEEILKDALNRQPANTPVMLKLMSIFASRKDAGSFSSYAQRIKDSGDMAAWGQAAEMGRKLEPDNPLYGASGENEAALLAMPDEVKAEHAAPVVDFDLGLDEPVAPAAIAVTGEKPVAVPHVDFDLGLDDHQQVQEPQAALSEPTMVISSEDLHEEKAVSLDFDVTATHPSLAEADQEQVAATEETAVAAAPENVVAESEFMLDFPLDDKPAGDETETAQAETAASETVDFNLGDISLDVGEQAAPVVAEGKDANWHEVATKLDLAKAYQEMGDAAGAREILDEVMRDGDAQQRETAEAMLKQLPA